MELWTKIQDIKIKKQIIMKTNKVLCVILLLMGTLIWHSCEDLEKFEEVLRSGHSTVYSQLQPGLTNFTIQ